MPEDIRRTPGELFALLAQPGDPPIPALTYAVAHPQETAARPALQTLFDMEAERLADIANNPFLSYTLYRNVQRYTNRIPYRDAYFSRRSKLTLAALKVLAGDTSYLDLLHDYLWSLCEQTTWILPQREDLTIELRVAGVAIDLAEIAVAYEGVIEDRAVQRIRDEIERKVFAPYLAQYETFPWYRGRNNWNGVCNGGIGAAFLLLERNTERLARALSIILEGLQTFLDVAFEADGTSSEGVGYWQYGMSNLICFAEMLRHRTRGEIDILSTARVAQIARYPRRVMLSPGRYFAFSDCNEVTALNPGLVACLVERTGVAELMGVLADPAPLGFSTSRFHTAWRGALWWDGTRPSAPALEDIHLPAGGVTRLVSGTPDGAAVVLAAKAGHNGVSHNHNDVGTFVLHVDGETALCDPERGLYDLYRLHGHDANVFANSYGHSVPVIGGAPQSRGAAFAGEVTTFDPETSPKRVQMSMAGAYEVAGLSRATRAFALADDGSLAVEDRFSFSDEAQPVQEAFVTWLKPLVSGGTALLVGERHVVQLQIEAPADARFGVEVLEEASHANHKPVPLVRLSFDVPAAQASVARVRARVLPQ